MQWIAVALHSWVPQAAAEYNGDMLVHEDTSDFNSSSGVGNINSNNSSSSTGSGGSSSRLSHTNSQVYGEGSGVSRVCMSTPSSSSSSSSSSSLTSSLSSFQRLRRRDMSAAAVINKEGLNNSTAQLRWDFGVADVRSRVGSVGFASQHSLEQQQEEHGGGSDGRGGKEAGGGASRQELLAAAKLKILQKRTKSVFSRMEELSTEMKTASANQNDNSGAYDGGGSGGFGSGDEMERQIDRLSFTALVLANENQLELLVLGLCSWGKTMVKGSIVVALDFDEDAVRRGE
jgi:hypothetical protein